MTNTDLPCSLPTGWVVDRLDALVESVQYGHTASAMQEGVGPKFLRITDIQNGIVNWDYVPVCKIDPDEIEGYRLTSGDIVFARTGATTGKSFLVRKCPDPAIFASYLIRLRPKASIDAGFLWYFFQTHTYWEQIADRSSGIAQPGVNAAKLKTLRAPVAPFAEQTRIVEAIDSYLSRLDAAVASLERVQVKLKAYRASVLKAAVEGRLVPTEAELARQEQRDYEPASVLLQRILKERRRRWEEAELARRKKAGKAPTDDKWNAKYKEPVAPDTSDLPELPEGWCWGALDQLSGLIRNGQSMAPRETSGVRTLRISAVRPLSVDFDDVRYLPGVPQDYGDDLVQPDDLLFTRYNGTPSLVGVCGRVQMLTEPTVHPDKLIKVRLSAGVFPPFVEVAANAGMSRGHVEKRIRTTAGQAGISGGDLKQTPIPIPPAEEQARIAERVEVLISIAEATASAVESDLNRTRRLRQSILKWAFEGKLVDQDPADEPAEELLARIRAERNATVSVKPGRRSRQKKEAAG